jgi:hypothetical protein
LFKRGAHRAGLGQFGKWPALGHGLANRKTPWASGIE